MFRVLALKLISFYQRWISPSLGARCRFYPSCSHYAAQCYQHFGFMRATLKTITRLLKCHPFHPGGYDPVKESSASWKQPSVH